MKSKLLTTTALAASLSITGLIAGTSTKIAKAQISNFTGPYIALGASNYHDRTARASDAQNIPAAAANGAGITSDTAATRFVGFNSAAAEIIGRAASSLKSEKNAQTLNASLGYVFEIDKTTALGVNLTYTNGSKGFTTSSDYTQSTLTSGGGATSFLITNVTGTQSVKVKDKSNYAIGIQPSTLVTNNVLLYANIAAQYMDQKVDVSFSADTDQNYTVSKTIWGYGLGAGVRYAVDKNLFIDFGADYLKFQDHDAKRNDSSVTPNGGSVTLTSVTNTMSTNIKPEYYNFKLSVGYKF